MPRNTNAKIFQHMSSTCCIVLQAKRHKCENEKFSVRQSTGLCSIIEDFNNCNVLTLMCLKNNFHVYVLFTLRTYVG